MALFVSESKVREMGLCHLLVSNVDEKELVSNYGYTKEEIEVAKSDLYKFDDFQYCRGNLRRAFSKKK